MCGICGKLNLNGLPDSSHRDVLGRMMQAMRHLESVQKITQGYDEMLGTAVRKLGDLS